MLIASHSDVPVNLKTTTNPPITKVADDSAYFIGDEIEYTITLPVPQFADVATDVSYIVTDTLDAALDRPANDGASFTVTIGNDTLVYGTDYNVYYGDPDNTIMFDFDSLDKDDWLGYIGQNVVIKFKAILNEDAGEDGIINRVIENYYFGVPRQDFETVYTYGIKVYKYDEYEVPLEGVEFALYAADQVEFDAGENMFVPKNGAEPLTFTLTNGVYIYDKKSTNSTLVTDKDGYLILWGLKDGTYYLAETKALPGYNPLKELEEIVIIPVLDDEDNYTDDVDDGDGMDAYYDTGIENLTGIEIPGTGGIGTIVFMVFGGLVVTGSFGMLIANRKRIFSR
jgi:fimbrial isopeptide formation D2 family protein